MSKIFSYLNFIWHDPNCRAWDRNPKDNKPYPHLVKKFGSNYQCTCGYDDDYERLQSFIKNEPIHNPKLPYSRGQIVFVKKSLVGSILSSNCYAVVAEQNHREYALLEISKKKKYIGALLSAWYPHSQLSFISEATEDTIKFLEMAEDSED